MEISPPPPQDVSVPIPQDDNQDSNYDKHMLMCVLFLFSLQEDALDVFLLMGKEYRISRSIRAQWFFQQFNSTLPSPKPKDELVSFKLN